MRKIRLNRCELEYLRKTVSCDMDKLIDKINNTAFPEFSYTEEMAYRRSIERLYELYKKLGGEE